MGFYLRKGIKVGPLRFNLSKSGVGISAGIRGLRIGSGPRGNYVHMGRHGLYYRATLPRSSGRQPLDDSAQNQSVQPIVAESDGLTRVESADVAQMADSSAQELLGEIDRKRKKIRLAPIVGTIGVAVVLFVLSSGNPPWLSAVAVLGAAACVWLAKVRDDLTKTVVLFYELDDEAAKNYARLHAGFDQLQSCGGKWRIDAQGATRDQKHHAGATSLVKRTSLSLAKGQPHFVKTNVAVPSIAVGRRTLWLFPDRILLFETNGVGAVRYQDVRVERTPSRFIEDGAVPADAKVVGRTWRYVNKSGGPDKRFKDNRELPVAMYEQIHLSSTTGLNELIQVSKLDGGQECDVAIRTMADGHSAAKITSAAV